ASNLVARDTNGHGDCFIRDGANGKTTRVSVSPSGAQFASGGACAGLSGTGRFVLLFLGTHSRLYVRDRSRNTLVVVSPSPSGRLVAARRGAISSDGQFVAFESN